MACVSWFISETSAGENCTKRCTVLLHDWILSSWCVSLEKLTAWKIVCILHISCGVMLRDIESFKTVEVVNNFWEVFDWEAHCTEDFFNFSLDKCDGVIWTHFHIHGKWNVIIFCRINEFLFFFLNDFSLSFGKFLFDFLLYFIDCLTECLLFFIGYRFEHTHKTCYVTFFAAVFNTESFESFWWICICKSFFKRYKKFFCLIHLYHPFIIYENKKIRPEETGRKITVVPPEFGKFLFRTHRPL